jgi:polyphosphate kinase
MMPAPILPPVTQQIFKPEHFLNRELSWLEFNQRVLDEALDSRTPLLERLKFFCITSSNLDEFFEVRVAGLKQQIESDAVTRSVDGRTATETFKAVAARVRQMVELQYTCWREQLVPELAKNDIRFLRAQDLTGADRQWVARFYRTEVRPVLTPLAIDPAHPFPQLLNKSLNIILQLEKPEGGRRLRHLAVVQVPRVLPRLVRLPRDNSKMDFVFLGSIIGQNLAELFPGTKILGHWLFRVTRNSELYIDEEEIANLIKAVEAELHNRRKGAAVRLEVQQGCPAEITAALRGTLRLTDDDVYVLDGPLSPSILMTVYEGDHSPELRDPPFVAPAAAVLRQGENIFKTIRGGDILLHHPYENFGSVVDFLEQAANDPKVLAIKQTLYRTGGDPRIIGALMNAVRNGKQVTAVVELRARFDEANNIQWARQLEENGVHVVYGLVGYKIHAKICLVVRRDQDGIRRYVHVATGNYNPSTARLYTDMGLFTCDPAFGEDATNLFNLLTGISQYQGSQKFLVAPFELSERLLQLIERETENAASGLPARIIAKINSLVDEHIISALYRASQAGVKIDLIVRGICCLRPGLENLSENITVRSIVDRFLEHSRLFYFENACRPEVFLSSADWMPRNLYRRIELAVPIENGKLRERVIAELLALPLADNVKARRLRSDGSYFISRLDDGEPPRRSQSEFIERAMGIAGAKSRKPRSQSRYPKVKLAPRPSARM